MGFLDIFRPKWRHSDPEVRAQAVRELGTDHYKTLVEIVRKDPEARIRRIALKHIDDASLLREIADGDDDEGLRSAAAEKVGEILVTEALDRDPERAMRALGKLGNARDFATVARKTAAPTVRRAALGRIKDARVLADVARRADSAEARLEAISELDDETLLKDVAIQEEQKSVAMAALEKVRTLALLETVARNAKNKTIRKAAKERTPAAGGAGTSSSSGVPKSAQDQAETKSLRGAAVMSHAEKKAKRARLLQICLATEGLARSSDFEAASAGIADLKDQWIEIGTVPGTDELEKRFGKALAGFESNKRAAQEREAQERAEKAEQQRRREADARAKAAVEAAPVVEAAPAEVVAPVAPAAEAAPVEDEATRLAREEAQRAEREARKAEDKARRDEARAVRIADLAAESERVEALLESSDGKRIEGTLRGARGVLKALKGPAAAADESEARDRLARAIDKLATRVGELRDAEDWKRWANVPKLEEICKEAEALAEVIAEVEDKRRAPQVLKELERRWKQAGPVPQSKQKELWERYRKAADAVQEKSKEFFEKLDASSGDNLKKKEELCVRAEALIESTDWRGTSAELKKLQDEWKTAGHVAGEQGEAIWKRFRGACDKFFARREEHDKSLDADRGANLQKKEELVAEAESLARSTDWKETADRVKALQEEWQAIGPVPREQSDEIWKRFRGACDRFFDARKIAFAQADVEREANLAKKVAMCEEAEALASSEDFTEATDKVKELQARWKQIGHVPREKSDEVWARFREACDKVFDAERKSLQEFVENTQGSGVSGFSNKLNLEGLAAKVVPAAAPAPAKAAAPAAAPAPVAAPAPAAAPAPVAAPAPAAAAAPVAAPAPAAAAAPVAAPAPAAVAAPPAPEPAPAAPPEAAKSETETPAAASPPTPAADVDAGWDE